MRASCPTLGILMASLAMTGCATHNYDFASAVEGPARIGQLVADYERMSADDGDADDALHEFSLIPLIHSHLHVFAESDEGDGPAGFVEAEIDTALPLFGFIDGTVSQYDESHQLIVQHEFDSSLWGLFQNYREVVATRAGTRETSRHTFLWIFSWSGKESWRPDEPSAPAPIPTLATAPLPGDPGGG